MLVHTDTRPLIFFFSQNIQVNKPFQETYVSIYKRKTTYVIVTIFQVNKPFQEAHGSTYKCKNTHEIIVTKLTGK